MKSVLISIQPYWVFLIIAKIMGWEIDQEKTVEVRKNFPKDLNWNKKAIIYCSKNKQSFNRIPKKYQSLMEKFLGKVIGKFVCDRKDEYLLKEFEWESGDISPEYHIPTVEGEKTCLEYDELKEYGNNKTVYFWHISNLVIYDNPIELGEFYTLCSKGNCLMCDWDREYDVCGCNCKKPITRPPMSWMFVEDLEQ